MGRAPTSSLSLRAPRKFLDIHTHPGIACRAKLIVIKSKYPTVSLIVSAHSWSTTLCSSPEILSRYHAQNRSVDPVAEPGAQVPRSSDHSDYRIAIRRIKSACVQIYAFLRRISIEKLGHAPSMSPGCVAQNDMPPTNLNARIWACGGRYNEHFEACHEA